ncbi:hypothetical protein GWO43_15045 [candidate division KSB1 bacterium]|nr:hypothetical protein [candidate division KSB1 bacterium]NIX71841.1 hypothetical protein [candidate division KSB1 bacterium]
MQSEKCRAKERIGALFAVRSTGHIAELHAGAHNPIIKAEQEYFLSLKVI